VDEVEEKRHRMYEYPEMKKIQGNFSLDVMPGEFTESEIVVLLGQNGTGKTTFIKLLAGKLSSDNETKMLPLNISYKPQEVAIKGDVSCNHGNANCKVHCERDFSQENSCSIRRFCFSIGCGKTNEN
jgi:translation initiation factor RLI1